MYHLFYPLFAMFLLTTILSGYMLYVRVRDAKSGRLDPKYFKTFDLGKPTDDVLKTQRHYSNLFELPVLYYLVVVLGMIFRLESPAFLFLAWVFVVARTAHMVIHVGSNRLYPRMTAFFLGYSVLVVMWVMLAVRVASGPRGIAERLGF